MRVSKSHANYSLILSGANTFLVLVLVCITAYYAYVTAQLRKDAKRQADAAEASLRELRTQVEGQRAVGRTIVANVIQSASLKINYWKKANIANLATSYRLPQTFGLVPDQVGSALEQASQISREGAARLRNGFDFLMFAQIELEILRYAKSTTGELYTKYVESVMAWLDKAEGEIELATNEFRQG